ncbi:hypothetical protein DRQ53_01825 [bacterium]|nr:MAG: hypothetical protein DRQ32_05375 [bacterium]RKZ18026.1 MAG: hypothetical protein DRQ53_01825 [bacterium]
MLTSAEADSCGVCVREKRADAFALADEWFSPGTTIRVVGDDGWKVLPGGEMELYFGDASSPTLSFRFHTEDAHLVGIAAEGFTDPQLATRILARTSEETGRESLIVIPFDYGDGESFLFDEYSNRVQVQCQVIADDSGTALQH